MYSNMAVDGVYVLVFSLEELKGISNSKDFCEALDFKADRLRFDTGGCQPGSQPDLREKPRRPVTSTLNVCS